MAGSMVSAAPLLPAHRQAPFLHAGFWRRFVAYIIDSLILAAAAIPLYLVMVLPVFFGASRGDAAGVFRALGLIVAFDVVVVLGSWLYFALCESSRRQATPGKLALGLCVTDLRGRRIGFGRASGRFFGKFVSGIIFDIGYLLAGWTARKQALHDLMADCCVVRREGLAAFERGEFDADAVPAAVRSGMPAWAIALLVVGVLFFSMIPVAAILAAIAIPAYQSYLVRAQISEGLALAGPAKVAIDNYLAENPGSAPDGNGAVGLPDVNAIHGKYVTGVEVKQGDVVITYGNDASGVIRGDHVLLTPEGDGPVKRWKCSSPDIRASYLPADCRR